MPQFAANLTMLFTELPFMERFAAAREAGFDAVEYLFPYAYTKEELAAALRTNGLKQVLHNLPAGHWESGERGIACHPDRVSEFRDGVAQAISYAKALHCPQVNCLAGKLPAGVAREHAHATLVGNLSFAAAALKEAGIRLLIEPINSYDIPGFFLTRTDQALAIADEVGSDNLFVQYDIYHAPHVPAHGDAARLIQAARRTSEGVLVGTGVRQIRLSALRSASGRRAGHRRPCNEALLPPRLDHQPHGRAVRHREQHPPGPAGGRYLHRRALPAAV